MPIGVSFLFTMSNSAPAFAEASAGRPAIAFASAGSLLRSRRALLRPGLPFSFRTRPRTRGGRSADRRTMSLVALARREPPRLSRRGASHERRDARLSALHRGDFRPGSALPSPAFPPDPCSELLAARSSCPAGGVPYLPGPTVTSRGRGTPLPAPPSGSSLEDAPHERGCQPDSIS